MPKLGSDPDRPATDTAPSAPSLIARAGIGGLLMGLANLVPGISGGTMLLAAGIYPRFIAAVADLSTLRFRRSSMLILLSVTVAAILGILLFAGTIKDLVIHHRWIMYSLFIGLTLGGVPIVWRLARPANRAVGWGAVMGFTGMAVLAILQQRGIGTGGVHGEHPMLLGLGGLAGASAMILPGVSGGYLLLVLGQYIPILSGIDAFKEALTARDVSALVEPMLGVLVPVGIGVLVGVVGVSNLLKWMLARFEKATLGVLLGLLLGAVVGLWPFQRTVDPVFGETRVKGQVITEANVGEFDPEDYPTEFFEPGGTQAVSALGLIALGTLTTLAIARLGRED